MMVTGIASTMHDGEVHCVHNATEGQAPRLLAVWRVWVPIARIRGVEELQYGELVGLRIFGKAQSAGKLVANQIRECKPHTLWHWSGLAELRFGACSAAQPVSVHLSLIAHGAHRASAFEPGPAHTKALIRSNPKHLNMVPPPE